MIPAALVGFSLGAAIAWWAVLRSFSHGAAELEADPMDTVQPSDPRTMTFTYGPPVSRTFFLDCE